MTDPTAAAATDGQTDELQLQPMVHVPNFMSNSAVSCCTAARPATHARHIGHADILREQIDGATGD